MNVEVRSIDALIPYARNPRKNAGAVAKVAASLKEFGWRQPIVVDAEGVVIVGHTRLLAARQIQMTEVPVHVAEGLTSAQVKAYRLADNRVSEEAEWDAEMLGLELADLSALDVDLGVTGFDADELARLTGEPIAAGEPEGQDTATEPVTSVGDVIRLGAHMLVCGDSTDPAVRARVTGGKLVGAFIFDPPFEASDVIRRFDLDGIGAPDVFVFGDCMHDTDRRVTVGHPWRFQFIWDGVQRWVIPGRPLVAHKTCDWFSATGAYDHDRVHDPRDIRTTATKGRNVRGDYELPPDPRGQCLASVFRSPITEESHGAEHSKPVLWLAMILGNASEGMVLDPFAGSGTSLIACERIGRPWAGIELNPAYCDVIVRRWEAESGQRAERTTARAVTPSPASAAPTPPSARRRRATA